MFTTSKMLMNKATARVKGRAKNSEYMSSSSNHLSAQGNATGDVGDYQITRTFMTDSYNTSEWIRAIVDRTVDRAAQIDFFTMPLGSTYGTKEGKVDKMTKRHMETIMNMIMRPNNDNESFSALVGKVIRDMCIYDQAGIQITKASSVSGASTPYHLYANVSGEEIYVNPKKNGVLPDTNTYLQLKFGTQQVASWSKHEMLSFIKNRRAGYANGLSPIEALATSIMGDLEAMSYNLKFFENNARPEMAFIFDNLGFGKGQAALARAKKWYLENHQGKPHLPLFMGAERGSVKLQDLKYSHKDMQFFEWQNFLLNRMMAVYGMQPVILGNLTEAVNKIDAETQTLQFKRNTIIPIIDVILYTFNCTLLWNKKNFGYTDLYLTTTNLDIEDEKAQAEIDEKYLDRAVITINQVRNRLQMPPVPWGNLPFVPLNYAPYDTLKKYQESKIASNINRAASDGIDNNVNVDDENEDANKEVADWSYDSNRLQGKYSALYPEEENLARYIMGLNKGPVPSGTEKMEPQKVIEVCTKIIQERESKLNKTFSYPSNVKRSNVMKNVSNLGLDWATVMEERKS